MSDGDIPESLRLFLATHINSIEELEVLVLLRSTEEREWSAAQISRELGAREPWIQDRLDALTSRGFLVVHEAESALLYRYAPLTEESRSQVEDLAFTYKQRRISVINLIYAKPESARPESDVVSFSNAFRIGKKKGGE